MSATTSGSSSGLLDSLARLGATLTSVAHTRLDLLVSDFEEDRAQVFSLLVLALVALFCLGVGVLLVSILLVVVFWDSDYRITLLVLLCAAFLIAGLVAAGMARQQSKVKPKLFAASLTELLKDREQLEPPP